MKHKYTIIVNGDNERRHREALEGAVVQIEAINHSPVVDAFVSKEINPGEWVPVGPSLKPDN